MSAAICVDGPSPRMSLRSSGLRLLQPEFLSRLHVAVRVAYRADDHVRFVRRNLGRGRSEVG